MSLPAGLLAVCRCRSNGLLVGKGTPVRRSYQRLVDAGATMSLPAGLLAVYRCRSGWSAGRQEYSSKKIVSKTG
jgi:hypothetical protein